MMEEKLKRPRTEELFEYEQMNRSTQYYDLNHLLECKQNLIIHLKKNEQ